jgi:hypothetical protein
MATLRMRMEEVKATHAQSKEFESSLDAIKLPAKPVVNDQQLDELTKLQQSIRDMIAEGTNPQAALIALRLRVAQILTVNANHEQYLKQMTDMAAPESKLNDKQIRELENVRHEILKLVDAGQNPEAMLDGLEERIKVIDKANENAEKNIASVTQFEAKLEAHGSLTDKQKVALHDECAELRVLIESGHDPKDQIDKLTDRLKEMETIKAGRAAYEDRLKKLADPTDATPKQAAFLASQRAVIRTLLDDEDKDARPFLDTLENAIWLMEQNNTKARENKEELAKLVDPADATPKQLADLLRQRNDIETAFDEGGSVEHAIKDLGNRIDEINAVNAKRKEYEAELAAIRTPQEIDEDKRALIETLRIQVREMIEQGNKPDSVLADLRQQCGIVEAKEEKENSK